MVFLYSAAIRFYGLAISMASVYSGKAALWIAGRKDLFTELSKQITGDRKWIWFHAASLGEFEQGRPLIELIKLRHPEYSILLTFFSPSGYEVRKGYTHVDHVCYMPLDTMANARQFVEIVNPVLAIFIKYEVWYHHLNELARKDVPTLLVSAQFRPHQIYFKWYGSLFEKVLKGMKQIFVSDVRSLHVLEERNFTNARLAGDTRIDRVISTSDDHRDFSHLQDNLGSENIFVAGSSWPKDEALFIPLINEKNIKSVIAPHEVNESHLVKVENALTGKHCRLSRVQSDTRVDTIIVDTIGDLAHIYHIATVAYVGGGFGSGIHNILEAAVFGTPVIFGPNYGRFAEARELVGLGAAFPVQTEDELKQCIHRLSDKASQDSIKDKIRDFFNKHEGATARIYDYICRERLLEDELET